MRPTSLAALGGDQGWKDRADQLSTGIDARLWDDDEGLWSDAPIVGGGASAAVPTLDGVLPALVTPDPAKAKRALDQLLAPSRFLGPMVWPTSPGITPEYQSDAYWRGTAWMQMNYLAMLAARRWHRGDIVDQIVEMSQKAVVTAASSPSTGTRRPVRDMARGR